MWVNHSFRSNQMSDVSNHSFCSPKMSDHERFAQVVHQKWANEWIAHFFERIAHSLFFGLKTSNLLGKPMSEFPALVKGGKGWWGVRDEEELWGMVRDGEGWGGIMRNDEGWWGIVRDCEGWWAMVRDDQGWEGMVRDSEGLWGMMGEGLGSEGNSRKISRF